MELNSSTKILKGLEVVDDVVDPVHVGRNTGEHGGRELRGLGGGKGHDSRLHPVVVRVLAHQRATAVCL